MTPEEFDKFWKALHHSFSVDPTSVGKKSAANRCYQRTKNIPVECLRYILTTLEDRESLPRNIAKVMLGCWSEWQSANKHRMRPEHSDEIGNDCSYCGGSGCFFVEELIDGAHANGWFSAVVGCGHCGRGPGGWPKWTIEQIQSHPRMRLQNKGYGS